MAGEVSVGSVSAEVVPDASQFAKKLRAKLAPITKEIGGEVGKALQDAVSRGLDKGVSEGGKRAVAAAEKAGQLVGGALGKSAAVRIRDGLRDGVESGLRGGEAKAAAQGTKVGARFGGSFARTAKDRIEAALATLPDAEIDADATPLERKLAQARARLAALRDSTVNLDVDDAEAVAKIAALRAQLVALDKQAENARAKGVEVPTGDLLAASAQLKLLEEELRAARREAAIPIKPEVETAPAEGALGRFAASIRGKLEAAFTALPELEIDANASPADRAIAGIRERLATLRDARVGIDVDDREAVAQIDILRLRLLELARTSPSIRVRADALGAVAELEAAGLAARGLDNSGRGASSSMSGLGQALAPTNLAMASLVIVAANFVAVMAPPVLGSIAGGIAAIGAAAGTVVAGAGVAALAFGGVFKAVSALGEAHKQAGKDAVKSGTDAQRSADAQANAADQVRSAEDGVKQARQGVADATREAARSVQSALDQQRDAERGVAQALRDERSAQSAVHDARVQAARDIQDLTNRIRDNALANRQSVIDVQRARDALALAKYKAANPEQGATYADKQQADLDVRQAQLDLDSQLQRRRELALQSRRDAAEKRKSDRDGVEGSDQVRQAEQRLADSRRSVADAERQAARASRAVTQARTDGARSVARAEQRVVAAQRTLRRAQRAQVSAAKNVETAGVRSADRVKDALAGLSPPAKKFARYLDGLRGPFGRLRNLAQRNLFPGLTRGITAAMKNMPSLRRLVGVVSKGLGSLAEAAGRFLGGKTFKRVLDAITKAFPPNSKALGQTIGNIATAFSDLFVAFQPLGTSFLKSLASMTKQFATFIAGWVKSDGFTEFVDYVKRNGPRLVMLLVEAAKVAVQLMIAFAPLGEMLLNGLVVALQAVQTPLTGFIVIMRGVNRLFGRAVGAGRGLVKFFRGLPTHARIAAKLVSYRVRIWVQELRQRFQHFVSTVQDRWTGFWRGVRARVVNTARLIAYRVRTWVQDLRQLFDYGRDKASRIWSNLWDRVKSLASNAWTRVRRGVSNALSAVRDRFASGVSAIGKAWARLQTVAKRPIRFIVDTVINRGIVDTFRKVAGFFNVDTSKIKHVALPKGFSAGGWTGPGARMQPAGIVHADEHVTQASSRRRMERRHPGLLDYINEHGVLPGYAKGGTVGSLVAFGKYLRKHGYSVTEGPPPFGPVHRVHAPGSYHYRGKHGEAIDVNAAPGTSAYEQRRIDKLVASHIARSLYGLRTIWRYPGHFNHVHFDVAPTSDLGSFAHTSGGGKGGLLASLLGGFGNPFQGLTKKIGDHFKGAGQFGSLVSGIGKTLVRKAIAYVNAKAKDFLGGNGEGTPVSAHGPIVEIVRRTARQFGWANGRQWADLVKLINSESGFNPRAQNPTSTAHGIFQFLDSTWSTVGGHKTDNPALQSLYGLRYIAQRYKNPERAWAFHLAHNSYDKGLGSGPLMPGLTLAYNGTGKPETVRTQPQELALQKQMHATTPLIGSLTVQEASSPNDTIDALAFHLRHARRGGVYATG